jgi:glutathione synthase/RimK-type ligase-like ATP-grasp enzyme
MGVILRQKGYGKESMVEAKKVCGFNHGWKVKTLGQDLVIPWGMQSDAATVNKKPAMIKAQNKGKCRLILAEAGVSVPKTVIGEDEIDWVDYPAVIRPTKHHKGQHLFVVNNDAEFIDTVESKASLADGWYISKLITKTKELRVHCAHGKVLFVHDKHYTGEHVQANQNINNEAWSVVAWDSLDKACFNAMMEALKAMKAIGLDFGGVDVMLDGEDAYVCEINTAPTQGEYGGMKYGMYFRWLEQGKDHWDFTEFTKAKSLIFKNFQLKEGLEEA